MSMDLPWTRARKTRNEIQEARLGTMEGGSRQVNSGRFWRFKRDGILHEFLIEARTNEKPEVKSYRIKADEFRKIEKEALQTPPGLLPAMQIDIGDLSLITLRLSDFQNVYLRLQELEARYSGEEEPS